MRESLELSECTRACMARSWKWRAASPSFLPKPPSLLTLAARGCCRSPRLSSHSAHHRLQLEDTMMKSNQLEVYTFNPNKGDANPAFSPEEEQWARGGVFETL